MDTLRDHTPPMETTSSDLSQRGRILSKEGISPRRGPNKSLYIGSSLLALLPIASFLAQYLFSIRAGTTAVLFHHLTVMVVDWVFVPFNFFVVRVVEWRRGGTIYVITCISVVLNVLTHAVWQYNGQDPGHMITKAGIVLPAGWVHLAFSSLETILLIAFVFCRRAAAPEQSVATILASIYFLTMGVCGYLMHSRFILSDVVVFTSGLFFVLIYPRLLASRESRAE
jgi:hypothetical protein